MEARTVIVVAGGGVSGAPAARPTARRRHRDRRRRRRRPGARARPARRPRDRRLRLGLARQGSQRPRRRAHASSGIRPPRTRPTSSSRSMPRSRSSRPGSSSSARAAAGSTTCSARCSCSADDRYAGTRDRRVSRASRVHVVRGSRTLTGTPGELVSLLPAARRRRGRHDRGARVPAARARRCRPARAAASRTCSPRPRPASRVERGCLLAVVPAPTAGSLVTIVAQASGRRSCSWRCSLAAGVRRREAATPSEVVLVTHDSFAIPKQVKAAFEQESGLKLRILQGGDAGETRQPGAPDEGKPAGRRPLRDRQQPALPRSRRRPVRAVRGEGARPGRRPLPARSRPTR